VTVGVEVVLTVVFVVAMGPGGAISAGHEQGGLAQPTTTVITIARAATSLTPAVSHRPGTR
jgi:hypothetical protein